MQNYGNMHDASPSSYGAVCSITVCTGDTSPIITIPQTGLAKLVQIPRTVLIQSILFDQHKGGIPYC